MSAGAYTVALEITHDAFVAGRQDRYVLRDPAGDIVRSLPASIANKRYLEQDAASRNRMARERARKEVSQ